MIQPRVQMCWPPPASGPSAPLASRHGELCIPKKNHVNMLHQFVCVSAVSESLGLRAQAGEPAPAAPDPRQLFQSPYRVRSRVVTWGFRDGNGPLALVGSSSSHPQNMPASGPKHHGLNYEVCSHTDRELLTDKREHEDWLVRLVRPSSRKPLCEKPAFTVRPVLTEHTSRHVKSACMQKDI